jgi:hypothetical protein
MNCTYTQGYWKNHLGWPTTSITLGTHTYDQAELLSILNEPAKGNGLIILAHQLIAVELNIAQGAIYYGVETARDDGHALIGSLVIPPLGGDGIPPREASPIAQTLDDFNNGVTGPGHCTVSTEERSWGQIKATYR